ncbi:MAG TPA: pepsin/retropepsin-like aspartic protease family protein [Pyrinomonadaceae bacterium]|nr:pepsin/retropepsin-like aspartic protease family protein [Pyrinomonadaceae bacterium]
MKKRLKTIAFGFASALLSISDTTGWAASPKGEAARPAARLRQQRGGSSAPISRALGMNGEPAARRAAPRLPAPARFRESGGRGLLVRTWVNGAGPYTFAIDTGAGATILSPRVAAEARVEVEAGGRGIALGGLSGQTVAGGRKAFVRGVAVGTRDNALPAKGLFIVAQGLPADVDGVLDPTETFAPLGYVIDIPREEIRAFDPRATPLRAGEAPPEGAVVPWLQDGTSRRPFVMLAGGRRALLDTGSGFGLAVDEQAARSLGIIIADGRRRRGTRDLAGGSVEAQRVRAATVHIGPLALRGVPTDFLTRAEKGAPVILGRDALRPFRLTFDPLSRLIMLDPE